MQKRRYFKQRIEEQEIALERVKILFNLAGQEFKKNPERSDRYAKMILNIVKKTRIRLPKNIKLFICKKCNKYLAPGLNLKVRSKHGYTIYECLNCGSKRRYGYLKEKGVKK